MVEVEVFCVDEKLYNWYSLSAKYYSNICLRDGLGLSSNFEMIPKIYFVVHFAW